MVDSTRGAAQINSPTSDCCGDTSCHLPSDAHAAPKFGGIGYFCDHLVTIALRIIELYHMAPFPCVVHQRVLQPDFARLLGDHDGGRTG